MPFPKLNQFHEYKQATATTQCPPAAFRRPWSVEEQAACFVVVDHSGQKLAYIYFEEDAGRGSAAKLLTKDEVRRIAANIANSLAQPDFLI